MTPRRSTASTPVKKSGGPTGLAVSASPSKRKSPRSKPAVNGGYKADAWPEDVSGTSTPVTTSPKTGKKKRKTQDLSTEMEVKVEEKSTIVAVADTPKKTIKVPRSVTKSAKGSSAKVEDTDGDDEKPAKKPRGKGKVWPPPELDPSVHPPRSGYPAFSLATLAVPTNGGIAGPSTKPHLVGAHCSIGGGAAGALLRAGLAGFNGVALFVKNQKQWKSNPMEAEVIERFRSMMKSREDGGLDYPPESILVHGSYLINLGNPDPVKWNNSYQCFKDDIERCHQLGIRLYNWHPGSTVGACTREEGYANVARAINRVHKEVPDVITVIENMANAKSNVLGTTFHDLAAMIALVENKDRVRICLDTCHLFAAGYDIRTPEAYADTMRKFREEVGNEYLAGIHLNDSKAEFSSCKDLHENIGLGHIGLTAFRCIMRDPLMAGIPMILETPMNPAHQEGETMLLESMETKMLYEIQAIPDDQWDKKKVEIEARWRADRDRISPPKEKGPPKAKGKAKGKGKKGKNDDEEACESHAEDD